MVRQRVYVTTEEKITANRAKSKRSYDKHRDKINQNRRQRYAKDQKRAMNVQLQQTKEGTTSKAMTHATTQIRKPVSVWLERTDRVAARLRRLTGDDSRRYLCRVVETFIGDHDTDAVDEHIAEVTKLQKSVCSYENEVLTLAGFGPEYERVKDAQCSINEVVGWLEEVLYLAIMADMEEVETTYRNCRFSFQ